MVIKTKSCPAISGAASNICIIVVSASCYPE